jgi:hypothetical protein
LTGNPAVNLESTAKLENRWKRFIKKIIVTSCYVINPAVLLSYNIIRKYVIAAYHE